MRRLEGVRDVKLSRDDLRPEYNVVFDRDRLSYYGISSATASQAVRNRIDGLVASKYREDGDEYDIIVRYAEPFRNRIEDVENITLYNAQGRPVKLKEVGTVEEEYAAPMIERENRPASRWATWWPRSKSSSPTIPRPTAWTSKWAVRSRIRATPSATWERCSS